MRLYYRDDSTHLSIILSAAAILVIGLTATIMHQPTQVQAQGGPSACPDPGQCTCNAASGVMTDHAMVDANGNMLPGAQINNGCTESGPF
jgi:hypothetical protein